MRLNAAAFRSLLAPSQACYSPSAGKHISLTLHAEAAGPEQLKRLLSGRYCHQSAGSAPMDKSHGSNVGHSPGPESRARSEHFPPGKLRGSWCKLLFSLPRPSGKDTGHSGGMSPQYKATLSRVSSPHLPLVPITPAQRRHSVSYPLAGHHSPTLWPAQSNLSRLRGAGPKGQASLVSATQSANVSHCVPLFHLQHSSCAAWHIRQPPPPQDKLCSLFSFLSLLSPPSAPSVPWSK